MANLIYDNNLSAIIPQNLLGDVKINGVANALDVELASISHLIDTVTLLAHLDTLPENILDLLAWQWHVDFYDNTLPIENKRKLVKQSIDYHRKKGTKYAVEQVMSAAIGDSTVEEWFEYGGEPYRFRIINLDYSRKYHKAHDTRLYALL